MRCAASACATLLTLGGAQMLVAQVAIESRLEILTVATGAREVVYSARAHFEAPNWSRDGTSLLFNQDGRLYVLPLDTRQPRVLDTGEDTGGPEKYWSFWGEGVGLNGSWGATTGNVLANFLLKDVTFGFTDFTAARLAPERWQDVEM